MSEKEEPIELRVAVFGDSGAGKTVLLSAFYATTFSSDHLRDWHYRLFIKDPTVALRLKNRYDAIEDGHLPKQTIDDFSEYQFEVFSQNMPDSPVRLSWYDYPGEWLGSITEGDATPVVIDGLKKLSTCQVGILLLDGQKFKQNGSDYVRRFFKKLSRNLEGVQQLSEAHASGEYPFPERWIVALSKSDMFGDAYNVKEFYSAIKQANLDEIRVFMGKFGKSHQCGQHFMILSALHDPDGLKIGYSTKTIGLRALAPALLRATMLEAAEKAASKATDQSWFQTAFSWIKRALLSFVKLLVENIASLVSLLPKKYRIIGRIGAEVLAKVLVPVLENLQADELAKAEAKAKEQNNPVDAVASAMLRVLTSELGKSYIEIDPLRIEDSP